MATTTKPLYATAATITCTLTGGMTTGQGRRSASITNSSNLYVDAMIHVTLTPGTIAAGAYAQIMAYASGDDGTTFETAGNTDAAYNTLTGSEKLLGYMVPAASATAFSGVFSLAKAYDGLMPRDWGIIVYTVNCGTLAGSGHITKYQGVQYQQV